MEGKGARKYGICAGKFRVLHKGHREYFIQAAGAITEKLFIVVSDSRAIQRPVPLHNLVKAVGFIMQDIGVDYAILVAPFFEELEEWEGWLIKNLGITEPKEWVIFNSKVEYHNERLDNQFLHLFTDRLLSSSSVENFPYSLKNSHLICQEFWPFINKKVVISGTESCGKTVMAKKVAKVYDTVYSEEYGRFHANKFLGGVDESYRPTDFVHIAMQQILQDKDRNLGAKRILVVDTDAVVTLRFLYDYSKRLKSAGLWDDESEKDFLAAEETLHQLCSERKADITILLPPNVMYFQDGVRWDNLSTVERYESYDLLKSLYDRFGIRYEEVGSSDYNERFTEVVRIINREIGVV